MRRWRRWTDAPLLVIAIGSLPLLLVELERNQLATADRRFLDIVNVVVFAVDCQSVRHPLHSSAGEGSVEGT